MNLTENEIIELIEAHRESDRIQEIYIAKLKLKVQELEGENRRLLKQLRHNFSNN